jgi:hypothetical protein
MLRGDPLLHPRPNPFEQSPFVIHTAVNLDGKTIANAVHRAGTKKKATR